MRVTGTLATRVALLAATSLSLFATAAPAFAQAAEFASELDRVNASEALRSMVANTSRWSPTLRIVTNDGPFIKPGPGSTTAIRYANSKDVLSSGINGVGQMIALEQDTSNTAFLALCTGTLINPRTVITAAHCVFDNPAINYGSNTGAGGGLYGQIAALYGKTSGIPLSFGFSPTNRCIDTNGCVRGTGPYETWRDSHFSTNVDKAIYNANQVWYDPISTTEFGLADFALVTLDTHVNNIPTWTLLFSPLTGSTHVTIMGYGAAGVGTPGIGDAAGIDYRRRAAENMIDALMSSADWIHTPAIAGPDFHDFDNEAHSLYWFDFDDPKYNPKKLPSNSAFRPENANVDPALLNWDFNGLGGTALPREGTTAGGDSGGPLIVDQKFRNADGTFKPVVAGVLTGGWSFNGGIGTYGEFSVYPPLFLYWQQIVANNPYKYVSAKAGDADWFDPAHWVQDMDPNYSIIGANDQLVNSLPNVAQLDHDSTAGRFGKVCFFGADCGTISGTPYPTGGSGYVYTPGGPGSTNFVPNNVEPVNSTSASQYRQARYYDVTLGLPGTTTLRQAATIDKLTVQGDARLNVTSSGALHVWSDFTQMSGWTNVDGKLVTGEAFIASGILSGSGTIDPTYMTVLKGAVAPGGSGIGTMTIAGNLIMSSGSGLLIDVARGASDFLKVIADPDNGGQMALSGSVLLSQAPGAAVARDGDKFVIASAQGGLTGKFASAGTSQGVLVPTLSYTGDQVNLSLKAGSLAAAVSGSSTATLAFANALDQLRTGSYGQLWNLYGNVDWMNSSQLTQTFNALSPVGMFGETELLQDRQSRQLFGTVSDRLSLMGTGRASGFSFSGGATPLMRGAQDVSPQAVLGLNESGRTIAVPMAGGMSGFVTISGDSARSSYGDQRGFNGGQHGRYYATGVEAPFGAVRVGTAVGYAESMSQAGADSARSKLTQAAAYASVPLGGSAYFGGIVAAEEARSTSNRFATDTVSNFRLSGATHSSRYMATAEAGFRSDLGHGLSLNPRAQLGFSRYALDGFREQGGETALELNSLKVNRLEGRLGARLDGTTHFAGWTISPQVQADYVRLMSGGRSGLSISFAAAPDYDFALPLTNGGSGWAEVKGGVSMSRGSLTLGLSGQATAGDAPISDQRGLVSFSVKF
ncbi:MAG: subtilase-type serine protease [Sphingomonadales bacterium]|nr:subtilase-type serine protease [Sphingomonadales bacterium]